LRRESGGCRTCRALAIGALFFIKAGKSGPP